MKSLHLPFHFHGSDRHVSNAQWHNLLHSDRFWAIAGVVVLLGLLAFMAYLAIRYGSGTSGTLPYPALAAHKALHDQLMSKVIQLNEKVQNGQMVASVSLSSFLKDWLTEHILHQDKKYGQFITAPVG